MMSRLEELTEGLRESLDFLTDGWQELWQKARNALTRFTPSRVESAEGESVPLRSSRWGLISADVQETNETIEVQLEAPGMSKADFEIDLNGRHLVIHGTKHFQSNRTEGRYHITERAYGVFERVLPLPCDVEPGSAKYEAGVLSITLPKVHKGDARRIQVH